MKTLYDNKCILKGYNLDNVDKKSLHKKQIVAIMDNDYVDVSYVYVFDEETIFTFPFDKVTFDSLCYLVENQEAFDENHPVYSELDMFKEAVKEKNLDSYINRKNNVKTLDFYKFILPVDEIHIVEDMYDTVQFSDNVLNVISYDNKCTFYTSSQVLCVKDNGELCIGSLMFYDNYHGEWTVMNLSQFTEISNIKYINFLYNIKFELK